MPRPPAIPAAAIIERPLDLRGREAALQMGTWLAGLPLVPDLAVASDSRRTRETLDLTIQQWKKPIRHALEPRIYEATTTTLLKLLQHTSDKVKTLLTIGHNPGFAELALGLAGHGTAERLRHLRTKFPTAAVAVLTFDVDHWRDVDWSKGNLEQFETPASLLGGDDVD